MSNQVHTSDPRILDRRTLERDHPRLAAALRPGMSVLDVGCGTGAITAGIARAVGPKGYVVGIDRDRTLLELARTRYSSVPNLQFEEQDVVRLTTERRFDVVTTSRTLQWIDKPELALSRMKSAAKPGGLLTALDYNHAHNSWEPEPPKEFRAFYEAFLQWRAANNWDNEIGDRLPSMFERAGLTQIEIHVEDEISRRGEAGFSDAANIWTYVIETIGPQVAAAGFLSEAERLEAVTACKAWSSDELRRQTIVARVVKGHVP